MMKILIILLLLLSVAPVFGELTKEDLRTVVREEIAASEKRTREYIDLKIDALNKSLSARIDGVEKRIGDVWLMMIALVGLITAAIAVPQIMMAYRDRAQKDLRNEIEQLRRKIEVIESTSV